MSCPIHVGNTVYVDAKFGNDKTGQVFTLNFPFATINAAIKALRKVKFTSTVEVIVRPGEYQEGIIYLIDGISLQGSGRLATQVFGNINTMNVKIESTILELSINSNDTPAILGFGSGKTSFRRMRFSATYLRDFNQSGVLITDGYHIFSESEGSLNNNGGVDNVVYRHLGGQLEVERASNTLAASSLPQVMVDPTVKTFTPSRGDVEYILTGTNQTINLPFFIQQEKHTGFTSINRPFLITQQSGGPSTINNDTELATITIGQTYLIQSRLINKFNPESGSFYLLKLSPPASTLENSHAYKIDNTNNIALDSATTTLESNNLINVITLTGKGKLILPDDIGFGYTFVNNGDYKIKSKKDIIQLPSNFIPGDKITGEKSKKIRIKCPANYVLTDFGDFIGIQVQPLNSDIKQKDLKQRNNYSTINSSLPSFNTSNTFAIASNNNPNFPPFSGNPVSGNFVFPQGGVTYIISPAGGIFSALIDINENPETTAFVVTYPAPISGPAQQAILVLSPASPIINIDVGSTYLIYPTAGGFSLTLLNPTSNSVGEIHTLEIPTPQQALSASTSFPEYTGSPPVSGVFFVKTAGLNYTAVINNSVTFLPIFDSNGNPSLTGPFTITIPANAPAGAQYEIHLTKNTGSSFEAQTLVPGNVYTVTPGATSYSIVTGSNSQPNNNTLTNSGSFNVTNFSTFTLPSSSNAVVFFFNISQAGVGSTISTSLLGQIISGDGQNGSTFTFNKPGSYRINNFLANSAWVASYFPANNKLVQIDNGGQTSNISAQVKFNNTTVQNGTQLETLIESNDNLAKGHINNVGIMKRKDLPAFIIPSSREDENYNIQQIGTEKDHYRGGNQIERTIIPVVEKAIYEVNEKDHTILLSGGNTIILPFIIPVGDHGSTSKAEVPEGTKYTIQNVLAATLSSTVTARGLPFTCGGNSSGSLNIQPNETVYLTAIAINIGGQGPSPTISTWWHVSRTMCTPP
jgi:hypothetical protein